MSRLRQRDLTSGFQDGRGGLHPENFPSDFRLYVMAHGTLKHTRTQAKGVDFNGLIFEPLDSSKK